MTPDPSWKEHVVRLSSAWLDGHDDVAPGAGSPDPPAAEEEEAQQYLADLLLVDALLANMSSGAAEEREQRIQRVMRALDNGVVTASPRARLLRWSPVLAVAALLLIAVMASRIQMASKSLANDVLLAVNEVSSEAIDRVYTIQRVRAANGEHGEPQGRLYLRGRSGFVVALDQAVLGRTGDQFWVVAPPHKVFLSADFQWIDARSTHDEVGLRFIQTLSLESRHIPLMQLASVAELMQHDYDVTLRRGVLGDHAMDLLIGQRRTPERMCRPPFGCGRTSTPGWSNAPSLTGSRTTRSFWRSCRPSRFRRAGTTTRHIAAAAQRCATCRRSADRRRAPQHLFVCFLFFWLRRSTR